jgi:hypothetical protein
MCYCAGRLTIAAIEIIDFKGFIAILADKGSGLKSPAYGF